MRTWFLIFLSIIILAMQLNAAAAVNSGDQGSYIVAAVDDDVNEPALDTLDGEFEIEDDEFLANFDTGTTLVPSAPFIYYHPPFYIVFIDLERLPPRSI